MMMTHSLISAGHASRTQVAGSRESSRLSNVSKRYVQGEAFLQTLLVDGGMGGRKDVKSWSIAVLGEAKSVWSGLI